jgi:hypothetical protein
VSKVKNGGRGSARAVNGVKFLKSKRRKTIEIIDSVMNEQGGEGGEQQEDSGVINSDLEMEVASTLVGMKWFSTLKK